MLWGDVRIKVAAQTHRQKPQLETGEDRLKEQMKLKVL